MNTDAKKILKIVSLLVFLLFILVYAFFRTKDLVFGVEIRDVNIVDGVKVTDNIIKIKGNAKNAINLTLNDRVISVDQQGNFDETIALASGYNIVSIYARDEFGNSDEKNYQIIYY